MYQKYTFSDSLLLTRNSCIYTHTTKIYNPLKTIAKHIQGICVPRISKYVGIKHYCSDLKHKRIYNNSKKVAFYRTARYRQAPVFIILFCVWRLDIDVMHKRDKAQLNAVHKWHYSASPCKRIIVKKYISFTL